MRLATVGTSWITDSFLDSYLSLENAVLQAVYSRKQERARFFAQKHGAHTWYDSLAQMAADASIDAVYIASPNALHEEQAALFWQNGKHVLCEKPMAMTQKGMERLYALADREKRVYCEAIMALHTPDLPLVQSALRRLGKIRSASLDFSQLSSKYPAFLRGERPNIFLRELGGGCLMDLGIYNVYLAYLLFGQPDFISAESVFLPNRLADACGAALLQYSDKIVTLTYSKTAQSRTPSQILGDGGALTIESVSQLGEVILIDSEGQRQTLCRPRTRKELMAFEALDFMRYTEGGYLYAPYDQARKAALAVSSIMEKIRPCARGFGF